MTVCKKKSELKTAVLYLCIIAVYFEFKLYECRKNHKKFNRNKAKALSYSELEQDLIRDTHNAVVDQFYKNRKPWATSNLGLKMFREKQLSESMLPQNTTFLILLWKYFELINTTHFQRYGPRGSNHLADCSVKNCIFTGSDSALEKAHAVVIHLQYGLFPNQTEKRKPEQLWIFMTDVPPSETPPLNLTDLDGVFNWSMTYRTDSDIPVPYGRTVPLDEPVMKFKNFNITRIIPYWNKKRRDILATILISNCNVPYRKRFIEELQQCIPVDVYGMCSERMRKRTKCPGRFKSNCEPITEYMFYLVLESSICREYLTEKIWHHAYMNGAIPVIVGPSFYDCEALLPPNSFVHVPMPYSPIDIRNLAAELINISQNEEYLHSLHIWRNHFKVVNEHGYTGTKSFQFCRVCEALNFNTRESVYTVPDLMWYLNSKMLCVT